jgi:uncharacterized protein (TIGR02271 family)
MNEEQKDREKDTNPDPMTGAPGSHPAGTAVGSAAAGIAGAGIGTALGGPVGGVVGAVVGAVAGAGAGHAVAEMIDPTEEEAYWKEHHQRQPYAEADTANKYENYQSAYRTGWEGYGEHGPGKKFHEVADKLKDRYEEHRTERDVPWDKARPATEAAYERVQDRIEIPLAKEEAHVGKREVESGQVQVRKEVHTETVNQPVELRREEVVVEHVPGTGQPAPGEAFEQKEIRVPVKHEEPVVNKEVTSAGAVRVSKEANVETQNVQEAVRKEDVKVEKQGEDVRVKE